MNSTCLLITTLSLAALLSSTGCTTRTITKKKGMSGINSTASNTKANEEKSKKRKHSFKGFKLPFSDK